MPRKRKRDWPVKTYKFWVTPVTYSDSTGEGHSAVAYDDAGKPRCALPQEFWDISKGMQALWNTLVALRKDTVEKVSEVWKPYNEIRKAARDAFFKEQKDVVAALAKGKKGKKGKEKTDKAEEWNNSYDEKNAKEHGELKKQSTALWALYNTEYKKLTSYPAIVLAKDDAVNKTLWGCKGDMVDRFRNSCSYSDGPPHFHGGLTSICLVNRDTSGGIPIEDVLADGAPKFSVVHPDMSSYDSNTRRNRRGRVSYGTFSVGSTKINFRTVIHRPLPKGAMVKSMKWVGTRRPPDPWKWHVVISVEENPELDTTPARISTGRMAGIDLGWRSLSDTDTEQDYLRIGVVHDTTGQTHELRLPMTNTGTYATRPRGDRGKKDDSFESVLRLDEEIGNEVQNIKDEIEPLLPTGYKAGLVKMRQGGLVRLLGKLREDKVAENVQAMIKTWLASNDRNSHVRNSVRDRLCERRRHSYRNIAKWLTTNYDEIVWSNLNVKAVAESEPKTKAQERSSRYRHWAAIGELKAYVQHAATNYGCRLVEEQPEDICCECGAPTKRGDRLDAKCDNGHSIDQDVNAARLLLRSSKGTSDVAVTVSEWLSRVITKL
jgi:transposase